MKYVKLFENFTNEEVKYQNPNGKMFSTHTFGPEEHGDFCLTVSEWIEENNKPVLWCLYGNPSYETGFGLTRPRAETFWKQYVNGEKKFSVVELIDQGMDDKLIGVLHEGDKILMAFDERDCKVDPSTLNGLIFN
jgi:hypothetical protein